MGIRTNIRLPFMIVTDFNAVGLIKLSYSSLPAAWELMLLMYKGPDSSVFFLTLLSIITCKLSGASPLDVVLPGCRFTVDTIHGSQKIPKKGQRESVHHDYVCQQSNNVPT